MERRLLSFVVLVERDGGRLAYECRLMILHNSYAAQRPVPCLYNDASDRELPCGAEEEVLVMNNVQGWRLPDVILVQAQARHIQQCRHLPDVPDMVHSQELHPQTFGTAYV